MIHAELIHNPYLMATSVKFNGQPPRINCQIEKYENSTFKDWVHKVPAIFRDEMNGYDFDLNFTGTKADFEDVKKAFADAGVSQEDVRLFHKNELEDADTKRKEMQALLGWLKNTPNRKFDEDAFWNVHAALLEGTFPYIIIGTGIGATEINVPMVSVETVDSAEELAGTNLTNTPIVFVINHATTQSRKDLTSLLNRKDVKQNQLFFLLHPQIDKEQVTRVICDLGVEAPQVISAIDDETVVMYLRNYPITEYVRETIKIMEREVSELSAVLEDENETSAILNAEIHDQIDSLEACIERLKRTDEFFVDRDNFDAPQTFEDLQNTLEDQIKKWRNRKTKVVGDYDSEIAARDYDTDLRKYMAGFCESIRTAHNQTKAKVLKDFQDRYAAQGLDQDYTPDVVCETPSTYTIPQMIDELLALQEVTYEEPKTDIFNMFMKPSAKEDKPPVRVVTCYYEHWRNKATEIILPIAEACAKDAEEKLNAYYNALAEAFHIHLTELIREKDAEKDAVSAQLSDDERKLQEDNDWLSEFKDQLNRIERG